MWWCLAKASFRTYCQSDFLTPHGLFRFNGADGCLLPRLSLLSAGEVVHVWCAPATLSDGALAQQSVALPRMLGSVPAQARQLSIQAQDVWVADDQMRRALDALAAEAGRPVQVLDPLFLQRAIYAESPSEMAAVLHPVHPGEEVISAAIANGHWVAMYSCRPVLWKKCPQRAFCAKGKKQRIIKLSFGKSVLGT